MNPDKKTLINEVLASLLLGQISEEDILKTSSKELEVKYKIAVDLEVGPDKKELDQGQPGNDPPSYEKPPEYTSLQPDGAGEESYGL